MNSVTLIGAAEWQSPAEDSGDVKGGESSSAELGAVAFERALAATREALVEPAPVEEPTEVASDGVPVGIPLERSSITLRPGPELISLATAQPIADPAGASEPSEDGASANTGWGVSGASMTMEMPIARPATDAATATLPLASNQMSVDAVTPTGDASGLPMFDPVNLAEVDPGDAGPSTPTRVMYTSSGDTPGVDDIRAGTVTPRHARMVMGEGDDRVSLTIRMGDDGIRVHAQTATADAATALENASAELGQSMRDRGLDFAGFSATASEDGGTDQPDSDQVVQDEADGAGTEPDDESDGDDPFRRGVRAIA